MLVIGRNAWSTEGGTDTIREADSDVRPGFRPLHNIPCKCWLSRANAELKWPQTFPDEFSLSAFLQSFVQAPAANEAEGVPYSSQGSLRRLVGEKEDLTDSVYRCKCLTRSRTRIVGFSVACIHTLYKMRFDGDSFNNVFPVENNTIISRKPGSDRNGSLSTGKVFRLAKIPGVARKMCKNAKTISTKYDLQTPAFQKNKPVLTSFPVLWTCELESCLHGVGD